LSSVAPAQQAGITLKTTNPFIHGHLRLFLPENARQ
jgi:hypothetical protein